MSKYMFMFSPFLVVYLLGFIWNKLVYHDIVVTHTCMYTLSHVMSCMDSRVNKINTVNRENFVV